MRLILPFEEIGERDAPPVGGKTLVLARLAKAVVDMPRGARAAMVLGRKGFGDLRWEEI